MPTFWNPRQPPVGLPPAPKPSPALGFVPPTLRCPALTPAHSGCLTFKFLEDPAGGGRKGAATAWRASGLHTQQENRFNKRLLSPCCAPAVWPPCGVSATAPRTAGHLLNFLAGSEVPRLSVADVRVSPGMPAAICKGSVCDGGKHPEVLSQSRSGQPCVFPQATPAPSPGP